jgi:hypothetical protein
MNNLAVKERVVIGKEHEEACLKCLRERYNYNFLKSTPQEDRNEKTDCWLVSKDGKKSRCAIKARVKKDGTLEDKKTDILVSLRDPFYGVSDPETKVGRDMQYEYSIYISIIKGEIRMVNGKRAHEICNELLEEFMLLKRDFIPERKGYSPKLVLSSEKMPGCQVWLNYDARSKIPKLLAFIPPCFLNNKKEIKIHEFVEV